ncbi:class I SAM-dependent methyltransferase [Salinisphaera hydrothermalis]|uniref:class I SAM-dependent methyltransferase n=1 Tax=Salinisphaera hydrothermalis TaxID=563188 RepID=UPI00333E9467
MALVLALPALAGQASVQDQLQSAVSGPQRSAAHKQRDAYRHPVKTLEFFGLRPGMRVIEVIPGGGWYTEILAPFLHDRGQLIEASAPRTSAKSFYRKMAARYQQKLASNPAIYGRIELEPFEPPAYMALGAPGSADRVLTFRNMHDLVFANVHGEITDAPLQRFLRNAYQVLKPGGVLGIVAHRANPRMPVGKSYKLGRLPQAYVIEAARQAGFALAASSEVNANPKDSRKMPVWYLPPTLKRGATKRDKYKAIGEADNMTLKFVKPKKSAG